jgi:hypothetical protein
MRPEEPQVELQREEPRECVAAGASSVNQITLEPANDSDCEEVSSLILMRTLRATLMKKWLKGQRSQRWSVRETPRSPRSRSQKRWSLKRSRSHSSAR